MRTSCTAGQGSWRRSGTAKCLHNFGRRFGGYFFSNMVSGSHSNPKGKLSSASLESQHIFSFCLCFFSLRFIFCQSITFPFIKSFLLGYWGRCLTSGFCHFLFTCFQVFLLKLKLNWRRIKYRGYTTIQSVEKHTGDSSPFTIYY